MVKVLLWSGGYDSTVLKAYLGDVKTYFFDISYYDSNAEGWAKIKSNESEDLVTKGKRDYWIAMALDRPEGSDYMPCRNTIMVLNVVNQLVYRGVDEAEIYIGLIKNFPRYPDANQEWVDKINALLSIEFGGKYKVVAPFIDLTKDEVFKLGCSLGVKLEDTFSCNFANEDGEPCGECDNCLWRAKHKYPEYWRIK